mmetsp:Transcript_81818/g.136856  ORF Transcript_81818/g.136856 Transcript_81818/m.136856 type:complete len:107 (+) Transcript_81818:1603-1923(+)
MTSSIVIHDTVQKAVGKAIYHFLLFAIAILVHQIFFREYDSGISLTNLSREGLSLGPICQLHCNRCHYDAACLQGNHAPKSAFLPSLTTLPSHCLVLLGATCLDYL